MKRRIAVLLALIGLAFLTVGMATASATKPPDHKITLCHATNSNTNPYVVITVDIASTHFQGHEGHNGPIWNPTLKAQHIAWGDIIPPTSDDGTHAVTPKNWTTEGQAIYNAGCGVPQTTTTTTEAPTSTLPTTTTISVPVTTTTVETETTSTSVAAPTTTVPSEVTVPESSTSTTPTTTVGVSTTTLPSTVTVAGTSVTTTTSGSTTVTSLGSGTTTRTSLPFTGSGTWMLWVGLGALTGGVLLAIGAYPDRIRNWLRRK